MARKRRNEEQRWKARAMNEFAAVLIPCVNRVAIDKVNILTMAKTSARDISNQLVGEPTKDATSLDPFHEIRQICIGREFANHFVENHCICAHQDAPVAALHAI
ncbi:hypothetical protein GM51_20420 [freshwater metagenome]|uniref:Uncharacterized protein n=1 Tax=freshwater metagenome TaxID=449393 RepID=A0A094S5Q2_9ZZZZ